MRFSDGTVYAPLTENVERPFSDETSKLTLVDLKDGSCACHVPITALSARAPTRVAPTRVTRRVGKKF